LMRPAFGADVLSALMTLADVPDGRGLVWMAGEGHTLTAYDPAGVPVGCLNKPLGDVLRDLPRGPLLAVSDPEHDDPALALLRPLGASVEQTKVRQRAVLPLLAGEELVALLVVVAPEEETLSSADLAVAHTLAERVIAEHLGTRAG